MLFCLSLNSDPLSDSGVSVSIYLAKIAMMRTLSITLIITDVNMGKHFFILCRNVKKAKTKNAETSGIIKGLPLI